MQSNNSPNQVPDAAPLFDATLMSLLKEAICPEDLDGLDKLIEDNRDVVGLIQLGIDGTEVQMASTSPTQMSSQVPPAQPLLTTQMGSMGQMVQLTSTKQMVAVGQMVQLTSTKQMVAMG